MDSKPWVQHSSEEGSLDYDGRLARMQVYLKFNTIIHRQQAPFSGAVAGEQVIKIRSIIAFLCNFQFSFGFSFCIYWLLIILKINLI
jgi:hypothetical protein